ncbi:unnamed protein product [Chilo suppressalis]|uniref:Glycogen debranching enzyme n=1 Tax=Chilo suppressalis TaxID=168631 RepID=A0ABN8BEN0_CHISP|nr:unnamed protein product [Chilo suppressalis]
MAIDRCVAEAGRPPVTPAPAPAPAPASAPPASEPQVCIITLEHAEHHDSTLYRLEKGCYLQFNPGTSLLGRKVFLYTNYVVTDSDKSGEAEFVRNQYYGLEWQQGACEDWETQAQAQGREAGEKVGCGVLVTDADLYCRLLLQRAGCYHYYFVYDTPESSIGPQGSGWFQVAPTLRVGRDERIPLDGVTSLTVLAKCLGPLPRWESALRPAREAGYNLVHLTPVQELGASQSSYSIANQLRLNPAFSGDSSREPTFADVENLVAKMRTEWKMMSICDIVLNHTANETPWLATQPEATYNCSNCPHLRPAALLDAGLARLSRALARGDHAARHLTATSRVTENHHLLELEHLLESEVVPELRLHELFMCDVNQILQDFCCMARNKVPAVRAKDEATDKKSGKGEGGGEDEGEGEGEGELRLIVDPLRRRLRATVNMDRALQLYNVYWADCYDEESRVRRCCGELRAALEALNDAAAAEVREHLRAAVRNCLAGIRYERLQEDGPRIEEVSDKHPLVPRYFTWGGTAWAESASAAEALVYGEEGHTVMAHNGWVMDCDPLRDFAAHSERGRVYLRRELIAWGDSVKLRYGDKPEDSPFLWAHMREYVELTAEVFDGVRLDNCHSTPLHVAEYLLDCARNVKPDLYVVAELFTNSDHVDNIFVNRLGITSLIREAQSAWDAREQGRLVHRFGGRPVGSFPRPAERPERPAVAHAMLLDLTHDNPAPAVTRSVFDYLPTAGMVAMACCATGSTRGYDELVPHHIHVVDETRLYPEWVDGGFVLTEARRTLNQLHLQLACEGYSELYVDQLDDHCVAITRHHPLTRKSVVLVAVTAFSHPGSDGDGARDVPPLRVEGQLDEILFEMDLRHKDHKTGGNPLQRVESFNRHAHIIYGHTEYEAVVRRNLALAHSGMIADQRGDGARTELRFKRLLPGTVVAVRVSPWAAQQTTLGALNALVARIHAPRGAGRGDADPLGLGPALRDLQLGDFHALLYRCDAEERDAGCGGVYTVPGHGPLVYAGLQGVASLLETVCANDDLSHPVCDNLRAGDWLLEYQWARLERDPKLAALARRYQQILRPVTDLPRYLVPAYAAALVLAMHAAVSGAALARMSGAARAGQWARALALTSVQLAGPVSSAALPAPSPALPPPRPPPHAMSAGPAALHRRLHALLGPRHLHRAPGTLSADGPIPGGARAHPGVRGDGAPRARAQPAGRRPQRALQLPRRRLVVALFHTTVLHRSA